MNKLTEAELMFKSALINTGLVQPIGSETGPKKLAVLCRLVPGQDKVWLLAVKALLQSDINLLICRRYLLKDDSLVFCWYIRIDGIMPRSSKALIETLESILSKFRPSLDGPVSESVIHSNKPVVKQNGSLIPPGSPGGQTPPPGYTPKIRFEKHLDKEKGILINEVMEMPIPHVYRDLNVPNARGKGAKSYGGG